MRTQILWATLAFIVSCGQDSPSSFLDSFQSETLKVGDSTVGVYTFTEVEQPSSQFYTYLNMHYNEDTSVGAAKRVVEERGGRIIVLTNRDGSRNLKFSSQARTFEFDPNRIFTTKGIRDTLTRLNGDAPTHAVEALQDFQRRYLAYVGLLENNSETIISLHNNTNLNYSLASYLPGGAEEASAARVHRTRAPDSISLDLDDFFYTTVDEHYEFLANRNNNSVLQDNANVIDDGSLAVWCGRVNTPYINVEAEFGHQTIQYRMLLQLQELGG